MDRRAWRNVDGNEGQIPGVRLLAREGEGKGWESLEAWVCVMFNNAVTLHVISYAICIYDAATRRSPLSRFAPRSLRHRRAQIAQVVDTNLSNQRKMIYLDVVGVSQLQVLLNY